MYKRQLDGHRVVLGAPGQGHDERHGERREQQVVEGRGEQQPGQTHVAGGGVADEGAHTRVEQGGADRGGDDGEHRAPGGTEPAAVGAGQPGDVADDAQDERVPPGGVVGGRGQVGEESGGEADERAADVPVHECERDDREEQQVGHGAGQLEPAQDGDLDDEGDHDEGGREQDPVEAHAWSAPSRRPAWRARRRTRTG